MTAEEALKWLAEHNAEIRFHSEAECLAKGKDERQGEVYVTVWLPNKLTPALAVERVIPWLSNPVDYAIEAVMEAKDLYPKVIESDCYYRQPEDWHA